MLLAGCGSSSKPSTESSAPAASTPAATAATPPPQTTGGAAQKVSLEANPSGVLKYNKSTISVKSGTVAIAFSNSSPLAHNVNVESASGQILGSLPTFQGGTRTLTVTNLKPGTYKFFCSVPGHRMAGMEGTLVVSS